MRMRSYCIVSLISVTLAGGFLIWVIRDGPGINQRSYERIDIRMREMRLAVYCGFISR